MYVTICNDPRGPACRHSASIEVEPTRVGNEIGDLRERGRKTRRGGGLRGRRRLCSGLCSLDADFLLACTRSNTRPEVVFVFVGRRLPVWVDESSEGRDEARRVVWVPRTMRRIVAIDSDVRLVRLLQLEEEARHKDGGDAGRAEERR